jgi:hypothetical protein
MARQTFPRQHRQHARQYFVTGTASWRPSSGCGHSTNAMATGPHSKTNFDHHDAKSVDYGGRLS